MLITVKFTKIGNRIKYELPFKMFCTDMKSEIQRSMTLDKTDGLFGVWIGDVEKAFKKKSVIFKKVLLGQVYDDCDSPRIK